MTAAADPPSRLIVGVLGRAVGLRGEIELTVQSDDPSRFAPGSVVHGPLGPLTVLRARTHHGRMVVSFEGVTDRTGAERLVGAELVVPVEQARPLEPDEYWDHQLIGCRVVTVTGDDLGEVADMLHTAANDVLELSAGRLIPLIREVVRSVDIDGKVITVEMIPED